MKLIIDIDDKTYKDVKQFYDKMSEHECIGEYELAIAEGIPLEEELKKIKQEIHKLAFDDDDGDYMTLIDDDEAMELIDKHIAELKGE